jgi:hypothetical protein
MSTAVKESRRKPTPTNGHAPHAERDRRQIRRELVEACELFHALRGIALPPPGGVLAPLANEQRLTHRAMLMAEDDLCEALNAYLGERAETSETLKTREAKTALATRFIEFLRASSLVRHIADHQFRAKDIAVTFVSQDSGEK